MSVSRLAKAMRRSGFWLSVVGLGLLLCSLALASTLKLLMPNMGSVLRLVPASIPLLLSGPTLWLIGRIISIFAKEAN